MSLNKPTEYSEAELCAELSPKRPCVDCGGYALVVEDMRCEVCNETREPAKGETRWTK